MIARAVVVTIIPAVVAAGVGAEAAASLVGQAATGPGVIFAADAVWQWGLLVAAAGIVFRAGQIVKNIDAIEKARSEAAKTQATINAGIISRLESLENWRRETDQVVLEWKIRTGIDRRTGDGSA